MMSIALQKLGASKTTPTVLRHGPSVFGGLNLVDLRTEVGISQIRFFRHAIYSGSEAGKLLLISLKYTQIEAGIAEPLLEQPEVHVSYITPTWITSLRQFLYTHNITITLTDTLQIVFSGQSDQCIMNMDFLQRYTIPQQRDINLVRLYLQAITLSDISEPAGNKIRPQALRGYREENQRLRKNWPRQDELTVSQRKLWTRYISSHFLRYDRHWKKPLGDTRPGNRPRSPWFPTIQPIMGDAIPVSAAPDLSSYLSQLPRWHKRLLSSYQQEAEDVQVWKAFRSRRRLTIASDGGLKHKIGTFGWKIVDKHGITLFSGSGPVDGPLDIANSTRSELGGLTAPLLLCASLARYWGLSHRCKYIWSTDSKAAIGKVTFITRSTNQPRQYPNEVDYVTAIRELHKSLKGRKLKCNWVKGHQDDRAPYKTLSPIAQLNVDVDKLASDHYWSGAGVKPTATLPHLDEMRVTISINGVRFPSKIDEQLRYHINGSYLKTYMQYKYRWNEKVWNLIDFDAFGKHFGILSGRKKVQHMKFVHNLQSIGFKKQQMAQQPLPPETTHCPCCCQVLETQLHMLQCHQNPFRKKALIQFNKDCSRKNGNWFPKIFADLVSQWFSNQINPPTFEKGRDTFLRHEIIPVAFTTLVQQAILDQTMIGWNHSIRGFLAKKWLEVASMSYNSSGKITHRPDGQIRMRQVITALYRLTTEIWAGRNSALHTSDRTNGPLSIMDAEIVRYHREPEQLHHDDRYYCEQSVSRLLSSSASIKRRWLQRVKKSREKKNKFDRDQPRITKYFSHKSRQQTHQNHHNGRPPDFNTQRSVTKSTSRSTTVQRLMTFFLHERAPNTTNPLISQKVPRRHAIHTNDGQGRVPFYFLS
jgi:ribonuclease HI